MPVTTPPSPPSPSVADALEAQREEALIKEARQRARRRRQRYAALVALATVIVGVGAVFALRPDKGGAQPSATARPLAPATTSATRSTIVFASWSGTLYSINADGTGLHRLLSRSAAKLAGQPPNWPALSPDGRQVAFQTRNEPRTAIDVANLNGTNLRQIAGGGHPAWSPDGTKIAYEFFYSLRTPQAGVYVSRSDGTARHRLARWARLPAWSPDGKKLAYICITPQTYAHRLCVMNADGTGQHRLAAVGEYATPAWSPDGTKIAFLGGKIVGDVLVEMHVYVINANGTNLRRLPPPVSYKNYDCGPAWSPNGKQIAFSPIDPFVDGDAGSGGIYLMNPDGRHVARLKATNDAACGISWRRTPA